MVRSFPKGFNYPSPQAWPSSEVRKGSYFAPPWNDETTKKEWRGFCIVTNELARLNAHRVSELVIDVKEIGTGLNCRVFDEPCVEYDNLVHLLQRPGFSRINLTLLAGGQYHSNWSSFRSGYLKQALGAAPELSHVSLRITAGYDQVFESDYPEHCIPLRTIFPVDQWQKLKHFGLSDFIVQGPDLLSLLGALPTTLRSIELSFLSIIGDRGNYRDLLIDIRRTLGWRDRAVNERPKLIIHVHQSTITHFWPLRYQCVDEQANGFIYDDKENPFGTRSQGNSPMVGMGVERFQLGHCHSG